MKRFVYVCGDPGVPVPGDKGASVHVASVLRALQDLGLEGELHAARVGGEACEGLRVHPLESAKVAKGADDEERERALFYAGLGLPRPEQPFDFVYERYSLWHTGGLRLAQASGRPLVLEVNSPLPLEAGRFRSLVHARLADGAAELLMHGARLVVCVSEEVARWAQELRGRDEGVLVVENGVDERRFDPARGERRGGLPERSVPVVAFASSFRPWHGLDDLLDAFQILVRDLGSPAHLLCVGDGPQREPFAARVRELGLEGRVHLPGKVSHDEVAILLGAADLAVAPYPEELDFYFSPLKLFEFMALGLPTVATDVGQIASVLGGGERGLLVAPGDVAGMARRMHELLGDPAAAAELGARARSWVLEHATWRERVRTILDALEA